MTIFKANNYLICRNAPGPLKGFPNTFVPWMLIFGTPCELMFLNKQNT